MKTEFPKLDPRGAEAIFQQAQDLARYYCPQWRPGDGDPFGLTMLKLFSRLTELVIGRINRIPEKHLLAFYDFIGMDLAPAAAAKVPLTFRLAEGARTALIPERTKVGAAGTEIVFETLEPLPALELKIAAAYSGNFWADKYTDHSAVINGCEAGFMIFGGDQAEAPMERVFALADPAFDYKTPADLRLVFTFSNYQPGFAEYFAQCADGNGKVLEPVLTNGAGQNQVVFQFSKLTLPRTKFQGRDHHWLLFRPAKPLPWGESAILPEISGITGTLSAQGLVPDTVLANDTQVEILKGFHPFGKTPQAGDALYIRCEEAMAALDPGVEGTVELSFGIKGGRASGKLELAWEYWDGERWAELVILNDDTRQFLGNENEEFTGNIKFACPGIVATSINDQPGRWIRVRIVRGGYGEPGGYQSVDLSDVLNIDPNIGERFAKILKSDSKLGEKYAQRLSDDDPEAKQLQGRLEGLLLEYQQNVLQRLGEKMVTSGAVYQPPSYQPPFIVSLRAAYSFTKTGLREALAVNCRECREAHWNPNFQPFLPAVEKPALFLGLEGHLTNQPVSLFFALKPRTAQGEGDAAANPARCLLEPGYEGGLTFANKSGGLYVCAATCAADASGAEEWTELAVEDETGGFLQSGIIKLILPGNMARRTLFGKSCYWLKFGFQNGVWIEPPVLKGVYPNTVWAEQATVVRDEVLGSGNGRPGQVVYFCRKSILGQPELEVMEPTIPAPEELRRLGPGEEGEYVRLVKNAAGDPEEIWVRWQEVPSFGQSDSLSRHYLLDRINGRIRFGDGVHGMIPPVLPHNLVARWYKCGGGAQGNRGAGVITELKGAIPGVAGVFNPEAAAGGNDLETNPRFLERVPAALKTGGLAVTREDYEWLAKEASIQVLKAKCLPEEDGAIRVIIAPVPETGSRFPEAGLIRRVEEYLKERALVPIRERIRVMGPDYIFIDLKLVLRPVSVAAGSGLKENVRRRLARFFDLAAGGLRGQGWEFGEDVFLSDVAAAVSEVEEVAQIQDLIMIKKNREDRSPVSAMDSKTRITLQPWELPGLGTVTVNLWGGEV